MKLKIHIFSLVVAAAAFLSPPVHAHHGQDFLLVQDYSLPSFGGGFLSGNFAWERQDGEDGFEFSPGLLLGVVPRVALGVDLHFEDESSEGWDYGSVTPALYFQITPPDAKWPVRVAVSVGYQFANGSGEEEEGHDHHEGGESGEHHEESGHGEHAEEHEHEGHSHGGDSIHNHTDDLFAGRIIIEGDLTESTKLVLNILTVSPDGGGSAWGYAVGLRQQINASLSLGVEALGDFDANKQQEVLLGAYYEPVHHLTLKLGVGTGLNDQSPDFSVRTGILWRF